MDEIRLIDANALKKALKSNCKPELCHDYNTAWCESCCQTNDFEDLIDEAPTVEFHYKPKRMKIDKDGNAEFEYVPEGEWIKGNAYYDERAKSMFDKCKCSICGITQSFYEDNETGELYSFNFCPNCGADMRPKKKLQTPSCLTNPERQAELLERYKEE